MDESKVDKKTKILEGFHSPLEKRVLLAKRVRVTTLSGTTLTAAVDFIDRYNILMGDIVIPKHSVEMYEINPKD